MKLFKTESPQHAALDKLFALMEREDIRFEIIGNRIEVYFKKDVVGVLINQDDYQTIADSLPPVFEWRLRAYRDFMTGGEE